MRILTQICRILTGLLFIVSGLIKANDPIGFAYKLEEYFVIFGTEWFISLAVPLAILICVIEICCGVFLLIGAYVRANAWLLLLMIIFFTILTGYSAITNKVTDCGCFGDAIKLTPWESFSKDIVLLIFIVIIFIGQNYIKPLFPRTIQGIIAFFTFFISTAFGMYCYFFTPLIDFLPYKEGNNIQKLMEVPPGAPVDIYENVIVYEKEGKEYSFDIKNLPDDTYTWKRTETKLIQKGYAPPIHDFKVTDSRGDEYTDLFLADGYKLVIVQYSLEKTQKDYQKNVNELVKAWLATGKKAWGLTSTSPGDAEKYRHEVQALYEFYFTDSTPLKMMVRSNPGIILMNGPVVVKKWPGTRTPTMKTVQKYMK